MDAGMNRLPRARTENLLMENMPDGKMLYDTTRDTAHSLNPTAALVWQHCDGRTTTEEMIAHLRQRDLPASEEVVWLALDRLGKAHLLQEPFVAPVEGLSRRAVIRKLGRAASVAALVPVVTSIVAPTPAMATSRGGPNGQPNSSHLTILGHGGQATIAPGTCVSLSFQVRFVGSEAYVDETFNPNTHYASSPSHVLIGNTFCATTADAGKSFTLYATYRDPTTGVETTSTVKVSVSAIGHVV